VLDTCVLLRALGNGDYKEVTERILSKCDIVASSKDALDECKGKVHRHGMTLLILQTELQKLEKPGKLKIIQWSKLKDITIRKKPADKDDEKFLVVAAAAGAKCIITTDKGLLDLDPYEHDQTQIRVLRPEDYLGCELQMY